MRNLLVLLLIAWCSALMSADSLKVFWGIQDKDGSEFTADKLEYIDFKAWITNSSDNYISKISTNNDPNNSVAMVSYRATCEINFNNFADWEWRAGDEFCIEINDHSMDSSGSVWYSALATWNIPENYSETNIFGLSPLVPTSGDPLCCSTVYSLINDVYIGTVDYNGDNFDFSGEPNDNVTFKCWITGREDEIIDQNSYGSDYYSNDDQKMSEIQINRNGFLTNWASGDTLNVKITQHFPGSGYYTGESKFVFNNIVCYSHYGPFDIKFGLDYVYGEDEGGGDSVKVDVWTDDTGMDDPVHLPEVTALYQNYPNPFNPVTDITFELPRTERVSLKVYNSSGQIVSKLLNGQIPAGRNSIPFDGSDLNSGVYYYILESEGKSLTKKMLLIK